MIEIASLLHLSGKYMAIEGRHVTQRRNVHRTAMYRALENKASTFAKLHNMILGRSRERSI